MAFSRKLQAARLQKHSLSMKQSLVRNGHFPDGRTLGGWTDQWYRNQLCYFTGEKEQSVYKNGRRIYRFRDRYIFYVTVTDTIASIEDLRDEDYICPNCGNVSSVGALLDGCKYCGTHFEMAELFPKVTSYYPVSNPGGTEQEIKKEIIHNMLMVGAAAVPVMLLISLLGADFHALPSLIGSLIGGLFGGVLFSVVVGYLWWAARKIGGMFYEACSSVPMLSSLNSRKEFAAAMSRYMPDFSYDYFTGRVISMLECVIYSDQDERLPFYEDKDRHTYEDVIDSTFRGALKLEGYQIKDDVCTVHVKAFMENLACRGGRIVRRRVPIRLTVCRNLGFMQNTTFSMRAIRCRGCGSSFDAYQNKTCPYCERPYRFSDYDWMITGIQ
ncbi:MAG: hypothetical protein MJ175_03275 [Clostridia bacterium]|nr:hypothetical protein [Clostridia bacterium]